MTGIIDVHTHAFPDDLAPRAVSKLQSGYEGHSPAFLDGTVRGLLASMDSCGIEKSIVANIATKAKQFDSILSFCSQIASDRILPLASIHPDDPQAVERVAQVAAAGLVGIKLHPYYQQFVLDDEKRLFPIFEAIANAGLIVLVHTGFDFAFPRDRIADADKIIHVIETFPTLKFVASHFGAWQDWDDAFAKLAGRNLYIEISLSLEYMSQDLARRFVDRHPKDRLLFGTDSPWASQPDAISRAKALGLSAETEQAFFRDNALKMLGLTA